MKLLTYILIFLFFSNTSLAFDVSTEKKEARDFINNIGQQIIAISKAEYSKSQKINEIIDIVDKSINSNWISHFVLGIHYRNSTPQQQKKFTELYRQFMINTYSPKFKDYDGEIFEVLEVIPKTKTYLVKTNFIAAKSNTKILVDFRVKKNNDKFLVLDIVTEGISLIETQRSEFNSVISQQGMDSFLINLENKINKLIQANNASK